MIFKLKLSESTFVRPRVTPDPNQAALLERKFSELSYCPANGFHRDVQQHRQVRTFAYPRRAVMG